MCPAPERPAIAFDAYTSRSELATACILSESERVSNAPRGGSKPLSRNTSCNLCRGAKTGSPNAQRSLLNSESGTCERPTNRWFGAQQTTHSSSYRGIYTSPAGGAGFKKLMNRSSWPLIRAGVISSPSETNTFSVKRGSSPNNSVNTARRKLIIDGGTDASSDMPRMPSAHVRDFARNIANRLTKLPCAQQQQRTLRRQLHASGVSTKQLNLHGTFESP